MPQEDYDVANQLFPPFRTDLNNNLKAIATNNSGATEPTTTFPYMWWADTTAGEMKQRNAANDDWVVVWDLATGPLDDVLASEQAAAISAAAALVSENSAANSETNAAASEAAAEAAEQNVQNAQPYLGVSQVISSNTELTSVENGFLIRVDTSSGDIDITLPNSTSLTVDYRIAVVIETGSNNVNVKRSGVDTVNGSSLPFLITQLEDINNIVLDQSTGKWIASSSTAALSSPAPIGDVTPNTIEGTTITANGSFIQSQGAAVASAAQPNIWAGDGDTIHITGTTKIDDFTDAPRIGAKVTLIFDDVLILQTGIGITLPGGVDITTVAGDRFEVYADAVDAFSGIYHRESGQDLSQEITTFATVEASTTASIPMDTTFPQDNEGTAYPQLDTTITPAKTTDKIIIDVLLNVGTQLTTEAPQATLFMTGNSAAIAGGTASAAQSDFLPQIHLRAEITAGTTSAITFSVRFGITGGGFAVFINRNGANAGFWDTTPVSSMIVRSRAG